MIGAWGIDLMHPSYHSFDQLVEVQPSSILPAMAEESENSLDAAEFASSLRRKPLQSAIDGELCVLVPYLPKHVPVYHSWMQQQHLLDLTASERLTLEQEYANQISWTEDPTSQLSVDRYSNTSITNATC